MHQLYTDTRSNDKFSCKISGLMLSLIRQLLLANNLSVPLIVLGRSFIYYRNSNRPKVDPCAMPYGIPFTVKRFYFMSVRLFQML